MSRHLSKIARDAKVQPVEGVNLGKSIKLALKARGLKQRDLAEMLGTSESVVSQISNRASSTTATINAVAAALGMKPSELIALGEE